MGRVVKHPFTLTVDSGHPDEPEPRTFGSLAAAISAMNTYDEQWRRFAWITESRDDGVITHYRDGQPNLDLGERR
jgi:hypothetical protein